MRTPAGLSPTPIARFQRTRAPVRLLNESVEMPAGIIVQIIGHKPSAVAEKHYPRRPLDLLRVLREKIERWILTEAGIAQEREPGVSVELMDPPSTAQETTVQKPGG
jgi:hypothetical protein